MSCRLRPPRTAKIFLSTATTENSPPFCRRPTLKKFSALDNLPRLHGQSDGSFQDTTVPNEIEEAKKVFEYARRLPNVTSISIAGHSQGGVVASMLAGELGAKKNKAVVLLAPAAILRDDCIRGNLFGKNYDAINPPAFVELNLGKI